MEKRIDHRKVAPQGHQAFAAVYGYVKQCGLETSLLDIVWLRVSQINGCSYCVDLHWQDAVKAGVSERKLNSVVTWAEGPFFSARERAALAWAESLTHLPETGAPDDVYQATKAQFDDKELADLTYAIALMNAMNRFGVGFRLRPQANAEAHASAA